MVPISTAQPRVVWSFWIACGLAVTGAILPLVLAAGGANRIAGAAIPFGIAAMALAASALLYRQGRPLTTTLYFIAGMALVYGMLWMIAVPLKLAVMGTCGPPPAICASGFERPMSSGEDTGLAIGVAMGTLAILVGFFGLMMLFRIRPQPAAAPPTRVAKPWTPAAAETAAPAPIAEPAATVLAPSSASDAPASDAVARDTAAAPSKPARKPRPKRAPVPQAELAAPEERRELAAPVEPLELPAPSETESDTPS